MIGPPDSPEADQRKDEFLATLAHELRNPLAPIRFALERLKPGAPPATAARAREVIDRQVRQLVRLVDDLLDVSRITANKIQLRREPHALARLMETAVESIVPLATAAEQTLDVGLPSTPIHVHGDATRLVQIFANILNNAVKFTPRGGHIWFTAEQQSGEAVVRIRDTGIGIAPDVLPRVFDMFQQAEPILERSAGGLGIGLTLARRLVEMHDGRIEIRSAGPGLGTEVEIRLPIIAVRMPQPSPTNRRRRPSRHDLRVLIVEDNLDAAEMLDMAVSSLGHVTRSPMMAAPRRARQAVRTRRDSPGYRPAGDERLRGRADLTRSSGVQPRPYRRGHWMGTGRRSSESPRSRIRQPLHQASLPGGAGRRAWHDRGAPGVRPAQRHAANAPHRFRSGTRVFDRQPPHLRHDQPSVVSSTRDRARRSICAFAHRSSAWHGSGTRSAQRVHRPDSLARPWYCTFREADDHVGGDGRIRVLVSTDGETWTSAALVGEAGIDLRDPKLSITPDDRLMIVAGGSVYEGKRYLGRQPRVMFSPDGTTWSAPQRVLEEGDWLWRVTWHDGRAYGVSYKALPGDVGRVGADARLVRGRTERSIE